MKKVILLSAVFILTAGLSLVYAADQQRTQSKIQNSTVTITQSVSNKNQIRTQNEGEDQKLRVTNQEQENISTDQAGKKPNPRSDVARQHMSDVAQKVEELLETKTMGGIGEQVKEIAREQNRIQEQIKNSLEKINLRPGWLKRLIGPDYQAIKNLEKQIEENQLRIRQFEELKNKVYNFSDQNLIKETIEALNKETTALKEQLANERGSFSLLGWFFNLFVK